MSAYFEIDHLRTGDDGVSHFAYAYSLRPVMPDASPGGSVAYQASREETFAGTHRRQFISVPMRSIPPGTYDLRVEVRDLLAGTASAIETRFERE